MLSKALFLASTAAARVGQDVHCLNPNLPQRSQEQMFRTTKSDLDIAFDELHNDHPENIVRPNGMPLDFPPSERFVMDEEGGKIVNGVTAFSNAWNWITKLTLCKTNGSSSPSRWRCFRCGGSILDDTTILSAAHCCDGIDLVQVNTRRSDFTAISRTIKKHPSYNKRNFNSDVCIIKLDDGRKFSQSATAESVCLPQSDNPVFQNAALDGCGDVGVSQGNAGIIDNCNIQKGNCFVAGWGTMREGGSTSSSLREVDVAPISNEVCSNTEVYGHWIGNNSDVMICAGLLKGGKDACQGDSGGPLICIDEDNQPVQQGIVSWGVGCARAMNPGVYSRVTNFVHDGGFICDNLPSCQAHHAALANAEEPEIPSEETPDSDSPVFNDPTSEDEAESTEEVAAEDGCLSECTAEMFRESLVNSGNDSGFTVNCQRKDSKNTFTVDCNGKTILTLDAKDKKLGTFCSSSRNIHCSTIEEAECSCSADKISNLVENTDVNLETQKSIIVTCGSVNGKKESWQAFCDKNGNGQKDKNEKPTKIKVKGKKCSSKKKPSLHCGSGPVVVNCKCQSSEILKHVKLENSAFSGRVIGKCLSKAKKSENFLVICDANENGELDEGETSKEFAFSTKKCNAPKKANFSINC